MKLTCSPGALLAIPTLLIPLLLTACAGPAYYMQAISGQLALMRQREDIEEILSAAETDAELRQKLELTIELREFARRRLDLPDNGSYSQFVRTGRDAVTWNVVATPELSLEPRRWCFLVAGCVPYRGYFKHEAAVRFAGRLTADGYDVDVSPAMAYSTLGWFEDPLLDTMLRYRDETLAAVVFHELAHQKLYLRGDTAFNESFASFVEETGVTLWLEHSGRADRLPDWRRWRQARADFDNLLMHTRTELSGIYATDASVDVKRRAKATAFARLEADYGALVGGPWNGNDIFASWFNGTLNNARLALFASYRGGVCAFANLFLADGENFRQFYSDAAERAALDPAARRNWLEQPCAAVAPHDDL